MNYFVIRGDQQFGPYTLADLQRYLAEGNILPTDVARSEASDQLVPVQQIVGNINVQQGQAAPPQNYGQVPVYSQQPFGGVPPSAGGLAEPLPPGLHWAVVLLLSVVTCGIFSLVWSFIQANYIKKLRPDSNALLMYALGYGGIFLGSFVSALIGGDREAFGGLINLAGFVVIVIGHFSLKSSIEDAFGLQLSGVMTFFFNMLYFQYHLYRIRNHRLTGVWS